MMLIDMTKELAPIVLGLDVGLVISAAALVGPSAVNSLFRSIGRSQRRRRLILHRPVLAR